MHSRKNRTPQRHVSQSPNRQKLEMSRRNRCGRRHLCLRGRQTRQQGLRYLPPPPARPLLFVSIPSYQRYRHRTNKGRLEAVRHTLVSSGLAAAGDSLQLRSNYVQHTEAEPVFESGSAVFGSAANGVDVVRGRETVERLNCRVSLY